jgi:AraC-like DNA-binding protein
MEILYQPFQPTLMESGLISFGLSLRSVPACGALSGIVHAYLQIKATKATPYPLIPDGTQAVFISPNGSLLSGSRLQACDLPILDAGEYFGIWFFPGALRYFIDLNVSDLKGQFIDSFSVPWRGFRNLHSSVYQYSAFEDRVIVCEQWLLNNFKGLSVSPFDHALSLLYQSFGGIRVCRLSKLVGLSDRHVNRLFHLNTGVSTKEFAQTIRIQHACKQLYIARASSSNTYNDLGYFDQSHLIKSWNKFLLSSPNAFWERFKSDSYNS